jgi:hypothetical protein
MQKLAVGSLAWVVAMVLFGFDASSVRAQDYKDKTLTIIVGYSPGGTFDLYARVLARYIGRYLPGNPTRIVENMTGAGGIIAANHLYNRAKPDDPPHVREYTALEIARLISAAGFKTEQLLTERIEGRDQAAWVHQLLERNHLDTSLRGEQTYSIATMNPDLPVNRYPAWLYD